MLMNPVNNTTPAASGGCSRGIPKQLQGLPVPLSGLTNSMSPAGSQHVASQIGNEFDSFGIPELVGDDAVQRQHHSPQENNVQKFLQISSVTQRPGGHSQCRTRWENHLFDQATIYRVSTRAHRGRQTARPDSTAVHIMVKARKLV